MNILLDALPLQGLTTGISRYVRNLYHHIERLSEASVHYFTGRACTQGMPAQTDADAWIRKAASAQRLPDLAKLALNIVGWLRFEQRLQRRIKQGGIHLYHETSYMPAAVKGVPQVFTIHDLSLMKYRDRHPRSRVWFSDLFFKNRMKYVNHILTVSEFIRGEVCETLRLNPERITAVPLAAGPAFSPQNRQKALAVLKKLDLPPDYLLFVGTLEPRKNLPFLVKALAVCKSDIPLVLVGWEGWGDNAWLKTAVGKGMKNRIYPTGYVNEESLACLYSHAVALVFPSIYEGFGLPVLEAMACGCPVICSNAASLPEVAGDAALLIDPFRVDDLAETLDKVVHSGTLRKELIQKGFARSTQFSWEKTATRTLEVFRAVAGQ